MATRGSRVSRVSSGLCIGILSVGLLLGSAASGAAGVGAGTRSAPEAERDPDALTLAEVIRRVEAAPQEVRRKVARQCLPFVRHMDLEGLLRLSALADGTGKNLQTGAILYRGVDELVGNVTPEQARALIGRFADAYGYRFNMAERILPHVEAMTLVDVARMVELFPEGREFFASAVRHLEGEIPFETAFETIRKAATQGLGSPAAVAAHLLPKMAGIRAEQLLALVQVAGDPVHNPWLLFEGADYLVGGVSVAQAERFVLPLAKRPEQQKRLALRLVGQLRPREPEVVERFAELLPGGEVRRAVLERGRRLLDR